MKRLLTNTMKILLFLGIGMLMFVTTERVLRLKAAKGLECFYELPKNSVDVLIVGSSHVYRNINPAIFFEEAGIAAYDLGSPSQPVWNSYHYIVEALKTQKPKLIVLEVYKATMEEEYADPAVTIKALCGMHFSRNRWEAVKAGVEPFEERVGYFLGLPIYHSRYAELTVEDYAKNYGNAFYDVYLGFSPIEKPRKMKIPKQLDQIKEVKEIPPKNKVYLDRIVQLAKEEGIALMFTVSPFSSTASEKQPYWNAMEQYAKENDIPFLNGNLYMQEIGLNRKTDFGKANHLSHSGADKFSAFLCRYIMQFHDFEDHRGDQAYSRWQQNADLLHGQGSAGLEIFENASE